MKAAFRTRYGGPEVLDIRDLPTPQPRRGELLLRVHAATVNRTDCAALAGTPFVFRLFVGFPKPRRTATGTDFAGEVVALGPGVTGFAVGDRVFGFDDAGAGTHAQYATFPAHKAVAPLPGGLDYAEAAACAEGVHYALNFLRKLPLAAGQHALVNGATGAIGSAAVQLLTAAGVQVTAVCAGAHAPLVRSLGATRVIDYLQQDFTREDGRYDVILDAVGKSHFAACKHLLGARGIYASSELGPRAENVYLPLLTSLRPGPRVVFPLPLDIKASLARVSALVAQGKFRPVIDRHFPLAQIRDAFTYAASGQKIGNVILDLS